MNQESTVGYPTKNDHMPSSVHMDPQLEIPVVRPLGL